MTRKKKKTLNMASRQKKAYSTLNKRLVMYTDLVRGIIEDFADEASRSAQSTGYTKGEKPFAFSDYPETRHAVTRMKQTFVNNMSSIIYNGVSQEWRESNLYQDMLAEDFIRETNVVIDGQKRSHYYETDNGALKAFRRRQDKGLKLSTNIWNQAKDMQTELEATLSCAIEKGMDAVTLSKRVSKYLEDYDKIKKDYKELYGKAVDIHDCEYRSMRLARSEINMAYRSAENARWQDMDFVIGMEIKTSNNHPDADVCNELAGKYPKDFDWVGWHPNCRCFKIPILKKPSEAFDEDGESKPSPDEVKDMPDNFKKWVKSNERRILAARDHGTEPYFIRDNRRKVNKILKEKRSTGSDDFSKGPTIEIKGVTLSAQNSASITDTELNKIIADFATANPELFNGGFAGIRIIEGKEAKGYMANRREYKKDGTFFKARGNALLIANKDFITLSGNIFNPYNELRGALRAIIDNVPLTFNQEYALESVWHEIRHASAVGWSNKSMKKKKFSGPMELVNQFCARFSYHNFVRSLGGEAIYSTKIMEEGYGYVKEVSNFCALLKEMGVHNKTAYRYFRNKIIKMPYENIESELIRFIKIKGRYSKDEAEMIVSNFNLSPEVFKDCFLRN